MEKEAGRSFDPEVARIIARHYMAFEELVESSAASKRLAKLFTT
jgi:hypothetical protein